MKKLFLLAFPALFMFSTFYFWCKPKIIEEQKSKLYKPDSTSGLKISLTKNEFKMFEPIMVKIDYVNKHNNIDTIYYNFIDYYDYSLRFYIISANDKIFNKIIHYSAADIFLSPQYLIKPGDTISVSMYLTYKYGDTIPCEQRSFCYFGYLKPGQYKFYAYDFIGGAEISSNELSFNVIDLDEQDKVVLQLIKNKNYDEVFNNYPLNSFTEYAFADYFGNELYPVETWDNDNEKINRIFYKFINMYPNSLYNINMPFIYSYFAKISNKTQDIKDALNELEKNFEGSLLLKFIENKYIREKIIKNYYDYKKVIEETKSIKK